MRLVFRLTLNSTSWTKEKTEKLALRSELQEQFK